MTKTVMIPKRIDAEGCFYHKDLLSTTVVISDVIISYSCIKHVYVIVIPKEMRHMSLTKMIPSICAAFDASGNWTTPDLRNAYRISRSKVSVTIAKWLYS